MNIQLYVENQLCDFDKNTYFTLQKEFEDEAELIVKEIEYSYTISIPTSVNNKRIFGFIDSFDVANKFSRIYDAELYVDEILILKGKLKLSEIDNEYFKGNLYNPASKSISDILGDRMLNEIDPHMKPMNNLKDFNDQNNYSMGLKTTDIPKEQYRDNHICYPYVLYSLPYNDSEIAIEKGLDFYTQDLAYGNHTITCDNIFPSYNICSLLKDMFKTEGYNVQGNIFGDEKFKDLYQTFQCDYNKYIEGKNMPFYLNFSCKYKNLEFKNENGKLKISIPSTLQVATLWSEEGFNSGDEDEFSDYFDGNYLAGVDCPLVSDANSSTITINSNDQHMMKKGETTNGYTIVVPKSGWYRIHCDGSMKYFIERSNTGVFFLDSPLFSSIYSSEHTESVGGMFDEADNTSLEQQPFEFQIKKGNPAESPKLYSFNSGQPCMPTYYSQFKTTQSFENENYDDSWSGVLCPSSEKQALYGKNGKQTIIKEYSDSPTDDFICGARLGGALFSMAYNAEYYGTFQATNRFAWKGVLLGLPRADKKLTFIQNVDTKEKLFMMSKGYGNSDYEYAGRTAQILLKDGSYSNFDGYNKVNFTTGQWDTTSNFNKKTYFFEDSNAKYTSNSASTNGVSSGEWNINTVVWLEKGDNISFELIMPYHWAGSYTCCHSEWVRRREYVNATSTSFNFEMGFINSDSKWYPTAQSPIPSFDKLKGNRETNVNMFLPQIKCNDYLNNFLQTFNCKLSMVNKNTFSIDYAAMNNVMGNIISIENLANVKDAEFKTFDLPSSRELCWKIDKNETGFYHGNTSPYKEKDFPWYESGYTGSISITNETNTSGTIEKKESQWSYNWYKDIKFINGLGLSVNKAPISVISDKALWDSENTYMNVQGEALKTTATSRLFFLKKNTSTTMPEYIEFKYDEINGRDLKCRLVIPSNNIETKQSDGSFRYYILDYSDTVNKNDLLKVKTIADIFFNLYVQTGYQIDVPIKLSNDIYSKINGGTLIKFNDGLYKAKAIDGHDVAEQNEATLSLLTLK